MANRMAKRRTHAKRSNVRNARPPLLVRLRQTWSYLKNFTIASFSVLVISAGIYAIYQGMNQPLENVHFNARFERINTLDIEKVLANYKHEKLMSIDLDNLHNELESIAWVDRVSVKRKFPAALMVELSEHVAAARWGKNGLLNTRGELILKDARFLPPELPQLEGPDGTEWQVAQQYLELRKTVLSYGLNINYLGMDARGAWSFELSSGVKVKIGREATDLRFYRFSNRVLPLLFELTQIASAVDMRYSNGFAVQWQEPQTIPENSESFKPDNRSNPFQKSVYKMRKTQSWGGQNA